MLILRGGGATLKRSALLSTSSKIALSLVILAPLVSPLTSFNSPVYAAASLQTNGSNLTIDIDKEADETASLTGTTTSTTTVTTSNAVGYTLTAAINDASLQTLTNNNIEFSLSGADVSDLSFDVADKTEKLLVTNIATPTSGDATRFTISITVPATIDAGVYVIDINYNAADNVTRVVYTDNTEELILDLAAFVVANSATRSYTNVSVNGATHTANTIKGVYLYGEVPISNHFLRGAFYQCTNLVDVEFSLVLNNINNVTNLSNYFNATFSGCTSLNTAINFPAIPNGMTSVTNLSEYFRNVFENCTSLNTAINFPTIPSGMTSVDNMYGYFRLAFSKCSSLNQAIDLPAIPSGMTSVNDLSYYLADAFSDCTSLKTAIDLPAIPSGMTSVNDIRFYLFRAFYNCTLMTNLLISNIAPCSAGQGYFSGYLPDLATNYAGGTNPVTPDTPLSSNEYSLIAGYNYH